MTAGTLSEVRAGKLTDIKPLERQIAEKCQDDLTKKGTKLIKYIS